MDAAFGRVEDDGVVARIVLARPPLNVIHLEMARELSRALVGLRERRELRALVLSAEGRAFSAGVSIEDHLPGRAGDMIPAFHDIFRNLRALEVATIAAVQGAALGGGCELACFADFVIASEGATFGVPEVKLASFPPVAAVHFPHRIGAARTLQLVLSGDILSAREAERIGLVDRVVTAEALAEVVDDLAGKLREKSTPALRLARRAVLRVGRFEEDLAAAEKLFLGELMKTADATEGLQAFLAKRAPAWTHR
ncbi:MAG TPA: enoyl-CoA hydratase/isomerase family protein [Longimicrobiales bacterium]|nr:enoyl-CoA hydratase/isomerase family protein [Longimicrobiales bacterium]